MDTCYSVIKRIEILVYVTTRINAKNSVLSERFQTQKATYYVISFILMSKNRQIHRGESRSVVDGPVVRGE